MTHRLFALSLAFLAPLLAAGCGPSHVGTFCDPGTGVCVTINANGTIRNAIVEATPYTVASTNADGTTLKVGDQEPRSTWRVTPNGKELHGASSGGQVFVRR